MKVYGIKRIEDYYRTHQESERPLRSWQKEIQTGDWSTPNELKDHYPRGSHLKGKRFIFRMSPNNLRVVTKIDYLRRILIVTDVMTHAEYEKWIREEKKKK